MKKLVILGILLTAGWTLSAQIAAEIIKSVETKMFPDAKANLTLSFTDKNNRKETYKMVTYTKNNNQKVIVRFTAPSSSVGNDLIMLERNVWVYDKKSDREIRIPSNQSFGGTGFSYGDIVRLNFSDNYSSAITKTDADSWTLELQAKERETPYFRIVLTISKEMYPVRGICYSRTGQELKTIEYFDVRNLGGVKKPASLRVTSPLEPGDISIMTTESETRKAYPDNIFNKRNLASRMEENY